MKNKTGTATTEFPPRLHAIFARDTNDAVIFRRGPSKRVCTFHWDRATDTFTKGQWLKGRIYERRSDISPDGSHISYFAMNGKWSSEPKGSWTAVSRTPWLKALDLYGKGDCWNGGGLFSDNNTIEIFAHSSREHFEIRRTSRLKIGHSNFSSQIYGNECPGIYYHRLIRDGWSVDQTNELGRWHHESSFHKKCGDELSLQKIAHSQLDSGDGKGCYWDEHVLTDNKHNFLKILPDWEWAEVEGETLVYSEHGKLYRTTPTNLLNDVEPNLLRDFQSDIFEEIIAPY
ncbi:hypothetical protein GCM10017044_10580 [Kordiimonas sediminis]|uniref:Uncharacterized protein n=1 Tax=Kordiimonas sediminis TaxID=1735581 RepID=A0A919APJ1_9PROT|nr:hypothetical protein [Kordiimonas sediminis]GHF17964.1 hypothetical protein GCM10017044_10580 [Kordiimonas sediminis]